MTDGGVLLKHYYQLSKNIASLSDGQARLREGTDDQEDALTTVNVSIAPRSGPYRGGRFDFVLDVTEGYPASPPSVRALTQMYHPNVEIAGDEDEDEEEGAVCLNLLDELWTPSMTLEDVVQGLLFLIHNPNLEDPLSSLFCGSEDEDEFHRNVRGSLRGGNVAGVDFQRNLVDGYQSEGEEDDDDNEGAPGNQVNLELAPALLVEERNAEENEEENMDIVQLTNTGENQRNFISTLNLIVETDENDDASTTEEENYQSVHPLPPSLPSHSNTTLEEGCHEAKPFTLFSQLKAPYWSFDKMWTLALSSTVRTIVLGAQRAVGQPLARLDSSEIDVH